MKQNKDCLLKRHDAIYNIRCSKLLLSPFKYTHSVHTIDNNYIDNYCFSSGPLPCTLNLGVANPAFLDGGGGFGGSDSDNDDDFLGLDLPQYHLLT